MIVNILLARIAARLFNAPLMVDAAKAVAITTAFGGRVVDGAIVIDGPVAADRVAFAGGRPSEQELR